MHTYKAKVNRVIDGDTVDLAIDVGFEITVNTHVRILDLDTPEIFHPSCPAEKAHGVDAKQMAVALLVGKDLTISTKKKGKYGRYLAQITIEPDDMDFATAMWEAGFQKRTDYDKITHE